jgi:hypothetical protein
MIKILKQVWKFIIQTVNKLTELMANGIAKGRIKDPQIDPIEIGDDGTFIYNNERYATESYVDGKEEQLNGRIDQIIAEGGGLTQEQANKLANVPLNTNEALADKASKGDLADKASKEQVDGIVSTVSSLSNEVDNRVAYEELILAVDNLLGSNAWRTDSDFPELTAEQISEKIESLYGEDWKSRHTVDQIVQLLDDHFEGTTWRTGDEGGALTGQEISNLLDNHFGNTNWRTNELSANDRTRLNNLPLDTEARLQKLTMKVWNGSSFQLNDNTRIIIGPAGVEPGAEEGDYIYFVHE